MLERREQVDEMMDAGVSLLRARPEQVVKCVFVTEQLADRERGRCSL
jgi:hypothetical protein